MKKDYPVKKVKNQPEKKAGPSKETIAFLLNYSKALYVSDHQGKTYEMLLN